MIKYAGNTALDAGFHKHTFPISAGDDGRLPPIEAKLKGETAKTKPSSGLISREFFTKFEEYIGCCFESS